MSGSTLRVGSLFSGIGGFDLGFQRAGFEIAWQVENNDYCNKILEKHWPSVQRFGDIRAINPEECPPVDVLVGGYPCQPFSAAGDRKGASDDRYLWPEIIRLLRAWRKLEWNPSWCLFENVAGHIGLGLDKVLSELEGEKYACWPLILPACAVDAPHRRNRVWILAYSQSCRRHDTSIAPSRANQKWREVTSGRGSGTISNTCGEGLPESQCKTVCGTRRRQEGRAVTECCRWLPEPGVGRVAHGIPNRVDRLRSLGNAVVPQVVYEIARAIKLAHEASA